MEPVALGIARFPGIAGEDLNRCEREAAVLTQDCEVSKMGCCTASSQRQAIFEKGCGTLVWVRWEIVAVVVL